jgi:uncharacterized protein (TIGR02246 family)
MIRRRPPPALADTPEDLEAQLYEALQQGDLERLMALWADDDEIVCVHPGGMRCIGAAAIRASFEAIFAKGGIPVQPEQVHRLQQPGLALHHLAERIETTGDDGRQVGWLLSTNVYVKTALGWRLAAHHASPGMPHEMPTGGGDEPSTLH